ncbi:MAG TPA: carboxypeptidase-like regulatory domain-containing protein, partial [Puia sp.]
MKLTAFLLLFFSLQLSARTEAQNLTLSENNSPLPKVFREIKRQTGYTFVYRESLLQNAKNITIRVTNTPLEQALALCFQDQPFTYTILNKMIILREIESPPPPVQKEEPPAPPAFTLTGRVASDKGEPLAGASIAEKGTNNMVLTRDDGSFSITVKNENARLVISFVGYDSKEVAVGGRASLEVALTPLNTSLNDVVVVGYGTQKRKDLTGSVASVGSRDIKDL